MTIMWKNWIMTQFHQAIFEGIYDKSTAFHDIFQQFIYAKIQNIQCTLKLGFAQRHKYNKAHITIFEASRDNGVQSFLSLKLRKQIV